MCWTIGRVKIHQPPAHPHTQTRSPAAARPGLGPGLTQHTVPWVCACPGRSMTHFHAHNHCAGAQWPQARLWPIVGRYVTSKVSRLVLLGPEPGRTATVRVIQNSYKKGGSSDSARSKPRYILGFRSATSIFDSKTFPPDWIPNLHLTTTSHTTTSQQPLSYLYIFINYMAYYVICHVFSVVCQIGSKCIKQNPITMLLLASLSKTFTPVTDWRP